MSLFKEFREFALKGNVVDMAVGVIIGGAFGGIVTSFIADVVMPVVGIAGKADFSNLYVPLNDIASSKISEFATANNGKLPTLADARGMGPVLAYGNFLTIVVNFLILAGCVFMMVKAMNSAKKRFEKEQAAAPPPAPPEPPADVKLLAEIRDLLKTK